MKREEHILWKIANAYAVIYESQVRRKQGQLDAYQYAALIQPICIEVMNRLLALVEQGDFLSKARENAKEFNEEAWNEKNRWSKYPREYNERLMELFNADWIMREYGKFMQRYRHAIFEPDPVKRASELVIGMDSLTNWAHGCMYLSGHVMRMSPITGVYKDDYRIFTHMAYLLAVKGIDETMDYLEKSIPGEF